MPLVLILYRFLITTLLFLNLPKHVVFLNPQSHFLKYKKNTRVLSLRSPISPFLLGFYHQGMYGSDDSGILFHLELHIYIRI